MRTTEYSIQDTRLNPDDLYILPLQLFMEMVRYRYFKGSSFILFLNKTDLFEEKVNSGVHIGDYIKGYGGPNYDVVKGREFFRSLFISARQDVYSEAGQCTPTTPFFVHFTCSTDTNQIRNIFDSIKATVMIQNVNEMALS